MSKDVTLANYISGSVLGIDAGVGMISNIPIKRDGSGRPLRDPATKHVQYDVPPGAVLALTLDVRRPKDEPSAPITTAEQEQLCAEATAVLARHGVTPSSIMAQDGVELAAQAIMKEQSPASGVSLEAIRESIIKREGYLSQITFMVPGEQFDALVNAREEINAPLRERMRA